MAPKPGQIVLYVLNRGPSVGESRPAIVVKLHQGSAGDPEPLCQLQVFTDGPNDDLKSSLWISRCRRDEQGKAPGTWHETE